MSSSTPPAVGGPPTASAVAEVLPPVAARAEREEGRSGLRRGAAVRRALVTADLVGLSAAFVTLQVLIGSSADDGGRLSTAGEVALFALGLPVWVVLAQSRGLYGRDEERPDHTTVHDLVGVVFLVTFLVWTVFVGAAVSRAAAPDLEKWVLFWALAVAAVAGARSVSRAVVRRTDAYVQRTVIVGDGPMAQLLARKVQQHAEYGIELVGFVGAGSELREDVAHVPVLGSPADLLRIVGEHDVDRVVIAFTRESAEELEQAVGKLQTLGVQTDILPRFFSSLGPDVRITTIEGVQLVGVPPVRLSGGALAAKRAFDAVVALASLVVLSPLLVGLALWVRRDSPGPVLFRQTRLGLGQRPFTCLKFRTMAADTSSDEHRAYVRRAMDRDTLPEEHGLYKLERPSVVTRSGRFLRRTSLDELPQLFNVLRGEMSLVGPRPCIPYETELFQPHHFERFTVPAGITGLWQVKARAHATFGEALDMDVAYARGWSFGLDLLLLLETPLHLLRRRSTK